MNVPNAPLTPANSWIGLVAGGGRFPLTFARAARAQGLKVCCVGVQGMASAELGDVCDSYVTAGLARLGKAVRVFKRHGVRDAVMAGKIEKVVLFHPRRMLRLLPDWRTIHMWLRYASRNKTDDTILLAVIREFSRDNIHFHSALDFCPELLVNHGFPPQALPGPVARHHVRLGNCQGNGTTRHRPDDHR